MRKYFIVSCLMLFAFLSAQAQTPIASSSAPIDPLLKGRDLLRQLVTAIDASAFLNSFTSQARAEWNSDLTKAADAAALAKSASELSNYIKPGKFEPQFSVAQLKSSASSAKNYGDAAYVLASLESGLAEEAYGNDWISNKPAWLGELKLVK